MRSGQAGEAPVPTRCARLSPHLWSGDDFVGRRGKDESYAAGAVGRKSFRNIQLCKFDLLVPITVGVEVAAGVEDTVGNRVIVDFLASAVAKHKNHRRERGSRTSSGDDRWLASLGIVRNCSRRTLARRGRRPGVMIWSQGERLAAARDLTLAYADVTVTLQFDQQRLLRRLRLAAGRIGCCGRSALHHEIRKRRRDRVAGGVQILRGQILGVEPIR